MLKPLFSKVVRLWQVIIDGRPKCLNLIRTLVQGRQGIEIGGPTALFRNVYSLPIYNNVGSLDNCDFNDATLWSQHTQTYHFAAGKPPGKVYITEGWNLKEIPDATYDFLLSSHNLEHFANPIRALKEWQRILRPGGDLILILPHYRRTFDHLRTPTTVAHMWSDFEQGMGEDDTTHVEEIFRALRPGLEVSADPEFYAHLKNNYEHRTIHHHVFDERNSKELLESLGMTVLAVELSRPFHLILVAQANPPAGQQTQPVSLESAA